MKYAANNTGRLLKLKRTIMGISQLEANKGSLNPSARTPQAWSNVERGKCGLPPKHAIRVAQMLNLSLEELKGAMVRDFEESLNKELLRHHGGVMNDL